MITRNALIWLSRQEGLKDFATRFKFFKKLTTRFVAGDTIDETIPFIRQINSENCTASFDHLNESVGSAAEAEQEVEEYLNILAKIDEKRFAQTSRSNSRSLDLVSIRNWLTGTRAEWLKKRIDAATLSELIWKTRRLPR